MASLNTRLNIKKLDGNIVQKHGGSKQVGFKQLGPAPPPRCQDHTPPPATSPPAAPLHGVMMKKRVWFEVELQGAQRDREAEVFQVSNDDTAVAQRWLEDKQPEEKTNTDCLVKEQEKEYQTGWKIKTGIQQQNGLVKETNVTLFVRNMGFNESGEYKKTFIGSSVGTGSMQVLQGDEFEVEPQDGHTFEVEPHGNVDHVVGSQEVQTQDLIYYHPARDREQHSVWELFSIEKTVMTVMAITGSLHQKEHDRSILFGLPGSRQQKFLVLRFFDVKEQQGIDRYRFLSSSIVRVRDKV
ncbi:hypothetical protein Tco_0621678 [Tanacetum coccineum]